ncbi:hypothetical protein TCAL_00298 [Tigriopus californicus]|uniref:C1q domain-containing protein n=2 Tax=Tigriopus californicus TaxID=6832 RepID=A0A553P3Y6_TIGCA|nr:uncharacterized protein LOC131884348 isoform X1 [Tigriopus californicus]TRY72406.1 hypothetical protein TCAL_00298 [Tigriopus californicus]
MSEGETAEIPPSDPPAESSSAKPAAMGDLQASVQATFDNGNSFNTKLRDTLLGLISENGDRKSEIEQLRGDHEQLRKDHDDFANSMERENDLRKNEIRSLEEKQGKDNQARIADNAKLEGKLDSENAARKSEIENLDKWAKDENGARKKEIEDLKNFAEGENAARKEEIANLDNFARSENDGRIADIADINDRLKKENEARSNEDQALSDRIDKEISDRDRAIADLQARLDAQKEEQSNELDELRTKMLKENQFLKSLASKSNSVYFDAYRSKAYDGGGEENLTFQGCYANAGGGMDPQTGVFKAPAGGTYIFIFHIATHDNKKALLSIRLNGEEVASIFDQNHKDNHKNSMAGQTIVIDCKRGDEIVVYAYTGTWLADFAMNHYTHWIGLLLKPSQEEIDLMRKEADEGLTGEGKAIEGQTNGF